MVLRSDPLSVEFPAPVPARAPAGVAVDAAGLSPESVIDALAAAQHGIVTRRQLLAAGLPAHIIERRVGSRRIEPVHRGVYRVGPIEAPCGPEMAAVLACGDTAVVSHRSAGWLWRGGAGKRAQRPVEILVHGGVRRQVPGVLVRTVGRLDPDEVTSLERIPLTTPVRTILDLAAVASPRELEQALAFAERDGRVSRSELLSLLSRRPRHRGARGLRALIGEGSPAAMTRSEAEERLLLLIRKAGLRSPETNIRVEGYEVDFFWRLERLIVEVDGFEFHSTPRPFELDRRRDAALTVAGFRVIRLTWPRIVNEPEAIVALLARALG